MTIRCRRRISRRSRRGFTLLEVMLGASILAVVAAALIGGFMGQSYLNMNARNLMAAMNDATRVMEQIRLQNIGTSCLVPSVVPPINPVTTIPYPSWNDWLNAQQPGKTIDNVNANLLERLVVICQDQNGGTALTDYCGTAPAGVNPAQIGTGEWQDQQVEGVTVSTGPSANSQRGRRPGNTAFDPIRVTVSVGWAQQSRTVGGTSAGAEFTSYGGGKGAASTIPGPDADNDGIIESQAMLTTLVTCR